MKAKIFRINQNFPDEDEKRLNEWLSSREVPNIVQVFPAGVAVVFLYHENVSGKERRLSGKEPECPSCGKKMKVRTSNRTGDMFWGCPGYPECKGTRPFTPEDWDMITGGDPGPTKKEDETIPF